MGPRGRGLPPPSDSRGNGGPPLNAHRVRSSSNAQKRFFVGWMRGRISLINWGPGVLRRCRSLAGCATGVGSNTLPPAEIQRYYVGPSGGRFRCFVGGFSASSRRVLEGPRGPQCPLCFFVSRPHASYGWCCAPLHRPTAGSNTCTHHLYHTTGWGEKERLRVFSFRLLNRASGSRAGIPGWFLGQF